MAMISTAVSTHVASVRFDRPPYNHVSTELIRELADTLEALDRSEDCRVVVLSSAGKAFCAGADLSAAPGEEPGADADRMYEQALRLYATRKPIVVAVQGAAIGAGLGLALVGDFRLAAPEARFSANFAKLGLHAGFGISYTLPRVVGLQKASLLLQTGRRVTGEDARGIGLVDQLVPLAELPSTADALAREIAGNAPIAVQSMRSTLREGFVDGLRGRVAHELARQTEQRRTSDFLEGIRAVSERRPGVFTGH